MHLESGDLAIRRMIAGNPKTGRRVATMAIALFVAMVAISLLLSMRKKTAPQQQPPLLPQVLVVASLKCQATRRVPVFVDFVSDSSPSAAPCPGDSVAWELMSSAS